MSESAESVAAEEPARELAPEPSPPRSVIDSAISRLELSLEELQHLRRGLGGPDPATVTPSPATRGWSGPPADTAQVGRDAECAGGGQEPANGKHILPGTTCADPVHR